MIGLIAILGAAGAVCRYWLSQALNQIGQGGSQSLNFPLGTLFVNVLGSFLIGLMFIVFVSRFEIDNSIRQAVMIGFLGGFTTFSSFSLEVVKLIESQQWMLASAYMVLSVVLCISACMAGIGLGRLIAA